MISCRIKLSVFWYRPYYHLQEKKKDTVHNLEISWCADVLPAQFVTRWLTVRGDSTSANGVPPHTS